MSEGMGVGPFWDLLDAVASAASGIETEGHDPAGGHGAEHESPTGKAGDAQPTGSNDPSYS